MTCRMCSFLIASPSRGFAGGGATINLRLNGNPVAAVHPCEALKFTVNPGDYVFGIKPVPDLGLGITELGFTAKTGEHYGFRIKFWLRRIHIAKIV